MAYELGHGEVLVVLPGAGMRIAMLIPLARRFARQFRCIIPDIPASRHTAKMADEVLAAVRAQDIDQFHVLGISLGGCVAQQLAIRHPYHVLSLALCATFSSLDTLTLRHFQAIRNARLDMPDDAFAQHWLDQVYGPIPHPTGLLHQQGTLSAADGCRSHAQHCCPGA